MLYSYLHSIESMKCPVIIIFRRENCTGIFDVEMIYIIFDFLR